MLAEKLKKMKLRFALVATAALALVLASAEEEDGLDWKLDFSCGDLFYRTMHLSQIEGEGEDDEEVMNYISRNCFGSGGIETSRPLFYKT